MASSPSCSSTSPSTSTATAATDLQETDAFSDDSGVDVKPQCKKPHERLLKFSHETDMVTESSNKRNKRKSSEPKKRKDVLLMKRFRWETDEEDNADDVFEAIERERPSSGDSGCQIESETNLSKKPPEEKKKKPPRQWRKQPKVEIDLHTPVIKQEHSLPTTFRQSVIRKHEATSSSDIPSRPSSTKNFSSLPGCSSGASSSAAGQTFVPPIAQPGDFDCEEIEVQDDIGEGSSGRTSRSVGRPRNYKGMTRQRRIEANARERTRVHTISAAFENLRRAVPAYAHNQKLSKLAILRIASAYIVALACLSEQDYNSQDTRQSTLASCVEQCTRTIQAEGKSRRRTSKVSSNLYI
ncbi:hypothetical protein JTE90_014311 [Oedothorax gibbosus]|uniref:BHLH domain-containing protein n=1 Tax=Oedothorax gibbosus TaxID=931172 RepID=A0AAV6UW77_9ARAC|nr:hypothetical protein JTE90_014311 [Oedothorax gibbosus]